MKIEEGEFYLRCNKRMLEMSILLALFSNIEGIYV